MPGLVHVLHERPVSRLIISVIFVLRGPGFAPAGSVPDTGQTTCYDDAGIFFQYI